MKHRSFRKAWLPHLALRRAPMTDRLTLEVDVAGQPSTRPSVRSYACGRVRLFVASPF